MISGKRNENIHSYKIHILLLTFIGCKDTAGQIAYILLLISDLAWNRIYIERIGQDVEQT